MWFVAMRNLFRPEFHALIQEDMFTVICSCTMSVPKKTNLKQRFSFTAEDRKVRSIAMQKMVVFKAFNKKIDHFYAKWQWNLRGITIPVMFTESQSRNHCKKRIFEHHYQMRSGQFLNAQLRTHQSITNAQNEMQAHVIVRLVYQSTRLS